MVKKISILVIVPLLWVGCASKKCGPDDYDGLVNALLCDYDAMYESTGEYCCKSSLYV